MTTLPSPFVSGSLRLDVVAELELGEPPLVAEPEVACVVGAVEVWGALAALLAQAASRFAIAPSGWLSSFPFVGDQPACAGALVRCSSA